jgi:uncharacterized cupin superfamily protein
MAKRIDLNVVKTVTGSGYPAPFDAPCATRHRQRLGDAAGLTDFGVNLLRLPPGAWSRQRHWHSAEDEFVYVFEDEGEYPDIDLRFLKRRGGFAHMDGTLYPKR